MDLENIKIQLMIIGDQLSLKTNYIECYLFGSILSNPKYANDIDILILYNNEKQINTIRKEFNTLAYSLPIHMNYFTFEEGIEFDFVSEQKAELIFKV